MTLKDFNNKHIGKTIFITGDSPEMLELSNEQMVNKITIACNYSHMVYNPTYWIGAHIFHTLYSINFCSPETIKFFSKGTQEEHSEWIMDNGDEDMIIPILCSYDINDLSKGSNKIFGCMNIGMTATGLAYYMGASKIVYIGFSQRGITHFYDININYKQELTYNIKYILSKYKYKDKEEYDHGMGEAPIILEKMNKDYNVTKSTKISGYNDNLDAFTNCFDKLKQNNIQIISTEQDSILVEAGAEFIPLENML